jgi:hypothetical protein
MKLRSIIEGRIVEEEFSKLIAEAWKKMPPRCLQELDSDLRVSTYFFRTPYQKGPPLSALPQSVRYTATSTEAKKPHRKV